MLKNRLRGETAVVLPAGSPCRMEVIAGNGQKVKVSAVPRDRGATNCRGKLLWYLPAGCPCRVGVIAGNG